MHKGKILDTTNGLKKVKEYDGSQLVLEDVVEQDPRPLPYSAIEAQVRYLMGDVLTVIDASFSEGEQKKAVKDLIKSKFSAKLSWLYELCGYPNLGENSHISEIEE